MPRYEAPEILRSEAYSDVRRNDEGRGERSRWVFFSNLLDAEIRSLHLRIIHEFLSRSEENEDPIFDHIAAINNG